MTTLEAENADFSFVHFTDTHIMVGERAQGSKLVSQMDTAKALEHVIQAINTLDPKPAFAVLGGDLVSPDLLDQSKVWTADDYEPSYRLLKQVLTPLTCPAYMLLGNHDHREAFHRVMQTDASRPECAHYYSFDHQGHHFIALDSLVPGEPGGSIDAVQLEWLRADLARHADRATVVFVHHHLWPIGVRWMDGMRLKNADELEALLRSHPQLQWVICGHVHQDQHIERDGLTQLTSAATSFQISKVSQTPKLFTGPPSFRLVHVKGDSLSTRVIHLHHDQPDEF
ncbi:metallophosphoesterase [Candidatus Entotheonella palauensis]|uniref:metallophosphoesterase n=1 Tax=Candidatus Entotheonella palauensis TaxID=93172 RepID=UPI000B7C8AB0|nr:metallophosphoesterase [Candidatus Entotheonella palauensis]